MALHRRHTHGRVFRGEAAREQLALRKRETGNDQPVMHIPVEKRQNNGVKVVYVTLSQTFSGPAYYLTLSTQPGQGQPAKATHAPTALAGAPVQAQVSSAASQAASTSIAVVTPTPTQQITSLSSFSSVPTSSLDSTTFATSSRVVGRPVQAGETSASTPSFQATKDDSNNGGMSGGAKAGLAFGIIILIGALAGACYFFLWRKRKQNAERSVEMMNEKRSSFTRPPSWSNKTIPAAAATGAFAAPAMRSMDNSQTKDNNERRASQRDSVQSEKVPASVRSTRTTSTAPRLSLRPITQLMPGFGGVSDSTGEQERRDNPFNDGNSTSEKTRPVSPPSDPFNGTNTVVTPQSGNFPAAAAAVPAVAGAAPSPRGPGPNNVHRVQLDFKPSMDDELELRSGQLVRMLHEYDDGWALCIRMDRSHQGVAPRTCLSKLPVKPRPQGPPPQQGSRPGTANGHRGPPEGPGAMVPRPLTPSTSDRSISPPMRSEMRPSPDSTTPPTGSMPARKPVPGQAM